MALPDLPLGAVRRCAVAAVLSFGFVAPVVVTGPAWSTSSSASSASATTAARTLTEARTSYGDAVKAVELIGGQSDRLTTSAKQATKEAERLRAEIQQQDGGGVRSIVGRLFGSGPSPADQAIEAADNAAHQARMADRASRALDKAILLAERARLAYDEVLAEQARRQDHWSAQDAAEFARSLAQPAPDYRVRDRQQDARNRAALKRWERYLDSVGDAGVVPPPADSLSDPARLPDDLDAIRSRGGAVTAGVAELDTDGDDSLVVLPAETVRAVSTAFGRLGLVKVPATGSPSTFACGGLVADAWGATDRLPADAVSQWRSLAKIPESAAQIGDVLVLGNRRDGLEESGIYVGHKQVIVADPLTGTAAVQQVDRKRLYGVKRVGVPAPGADDAPRAGLCGMPAESVPADQQDTENTAVLELPVAADAYRISAKFGQSGSMWASRHTGQDFAAPIGTPVAAVADGVVTVENRDWAGQLVRIDHGGGVESWYAHLSEVDVVSGEQIAKGEQVGAVGNEGNSKGPHLHLEVRLDGRAVDPAMVLAIPEVPRGDHPNGDLPDAALCSASPGTSHLLACDAAVSFRLMSAAYTAELGKPLCITDSYRSLADLSALTRGQTGSATSTVHGLGRAVDLCGGVERLDTAEHRWIAKHGASFGWVTPTWAAAGGSRPEPWHFESS